MLPDNETPEAPAVLSGDARTAAIDDARAIGGSPGRRAPLTAEEVAALAATIGKKDDAAERARLAVADLVPALAVMDELVAGALLRDTAKACRLPVQEFRGAVAKARRTSSPADSGPDLFPAVEPWPDPVLLADVLTDAAAYLRRFAILPDNAAEVLSLWAAMTWTFESFDRIPLLLLTSPAPRSGKSTVLELLGRLVARPLATVSVSPAVLYRIIGQARPTIMLDEADTLLKDSPDLTAIVNAAHARESARVVRCHPETLEPEVFTCYAPIALAGNNPRMADATRDRTIAVKMRRKGADERCDKARARVVKPAALPIVQKFARLSLDLPAMLEEVECPPMPDCLHDRAADCWEPLFHLAEVAGGPWPDAVRIAATATAAGSDDAETMGIRLLSDLRDLFASEDADRLSSERIVECLGSDKEGPWGEEPRLTQHRLARWLKPFGITSKGIRMPDGRTPKGYLLTDLEAVFSRYLPGTPKTSATTPQASNDTAKPDFQTATLTHPVAFEKSQITASDRPCGVVADISTPRGKNCVRCGRFDFYTEEVPGIGPVCGDCLSPEEVDAPTSPDLPPAVAEYLARKAAGEAT